MKRYMLLPLSLLAVLTTGCASTITALYNKPVTSDHLDEYGEANKLKTVSGDRRLVRFHKVSEPENFLICAETQADAISASGGATNFKINAPGNMSPDLSEAANQSLLLTTARSPVSDVVRQLAWNYCNAEMNNFITKEQYYTLMYELQRSAFDALTNPASANDGAKPKEGATLKTDVKAGS